MVHASIGEEGRIIVGHGGRGRDKRVVMILEELVTYSTETSVGSHLTDWRQQIHIVMQGLKYPSISVALAYERLSPQIRNTVCVKNEYSH